MSNVDTAKSALWAFSQGDLAALKEFHSEDAVYERHGFRTPGRWHSSDELRPRGEVRGRDAIVDIFVRWPDYWSTVITEPSEYIDGGEYVGVLGTLRFANSKGSKEFPFVLVLRFDCDGKVVRAEFHADSAKVATRETEHHNIVANAHQAAMSSGTDFGGKMFSDVATEAPAAHDPRRRVYGPFILGKMLACQDDTSGACAAAEAAIEVAADVTGQLVMSDGVSRHSATGV
jgi:uncharacterized protein